MPCCISCKTIYSIKKIQMDCTWILHCDPGWFNSSSSYKNLLGYINALPSLFSSKTYRAGSWEQVVTSYTPSPQPRYNSTYGEDPGNGIARLVWRKSLSTSLMTSSGCIDLITKLTKGYDFALLCENAQRFFKMLQSNVNIQRMKRTIMRRWVSEFNHRLIL